MLTKKGPLWLTSTDLSVTHHRGYLTCWNMGGVTVSQRVLMKGQKMWQTTLWQFWPKFGHFVHKHLNFASAVYCRCMPVFHLKLSQKKLLKYPATVWRNLVFVTLPKARWRNENLVRCVTVSHGWRIDQNCTVFHNHLVEIVKLTGFTLFYILCI